MIRFIENVLKNVAVCCRLFSVVVYVITLFVLSVKLGQFVRPEVKQVHFELIVWDIDSNIVILSYCLLAVPTVMGLMQNLLVVIIISSTWRRDVKPFQVELISLSSQKWLRFISALMTTGTSVTSQVELCLCLPAVNQSQTKVMQPVLCVWSVLYNESTKVLTQKEKSTLICIPVLRVLETFSGVESYGGRKQRGVRLWGS